MNRLRPSLAIAIPVGEPAYALALNLLTACILCSRDFGLHQMSTGVMSLGMSIDITAPVAAVTYLRCCSARLGIPPPTLPFSRISLYFRRFPGSGFEMAYGSRSYKNETHVV